MDGLFLYERDHVRGNMNKIPFLVFGSQLFDPKKYFPNQPILLIEHKNLCTYYKFHKHKLVFFLSAMRHFRDELLALGFTVHYLTIRESERFESYEEALDFMLNQMGAHQLTCFEIEDKFMESRIQNYSKQKNKELCFIKNPNFLTSREDFKVYLKNTKKPFMKSFYEGQRKRFRILVIQDQKPEGGSWSFDLQNRKPLPKGLVLPKISSYELDAIDKNVIEDVDYYFSSHIGNTDTVWLPTQRHEAQRWFKKFIQERLEFFGPFEDAFDPKQDIIYHSCITPFLNVGLLNPDDLIKLVLKAYKEGVAPLNSVEGFIRQIIGWREFVRGIYQNYSEVQEQSNFFNHERRLNLNWYTGHTGCPPLDDVIQKTIKLSWCHHIERLMVLSNMMNLSEIHPQEAHKWFMELFVDSSDWVMGPNVYGMGLMSDGGLFATKPYICGSNYWLKMSPYKKEDWCLEVDGLYWRFVREKFSFLNNNPRLSMMTKTYEKMASHKKESLEKAAQSFLKRNTTEFGI